MTSKAENRIKLMLVGEENVGKTSLLRALKLHLASSTRKRKQTMTLGRATALLTFSGSKKVLHEDETQVSGDTLSTDGIDLTVEPLPLSELALSLSSSKDRKAFKHPMSFSVWDFGGQEVYHTTHSFFLTERSIYLVVFRADREEANSRVAYWLNAISCHAPNAPIIIVATHLDKYVDAKGNKKLKQKEVEEALTGPIMEKYKSKFPKLERQVRAVSTLNLKGLDELIRQIHDVAMKQPYAQEMPPERWFDLESIFLDKRRRDLEENLVPVLSWEDVINVSRIALFPTNDNQAELTKAIDFLHEIGSIFKHVYTDETTGLTQTQVIVDPQWIARVFATVLTTKHGFLKSGVMDEQKLYEQLWREYPKSIHSLLMHLFQQFDLVYKNQDQNGKFTGEILIPATLPVQKPSDISTLLPGKDTSLYQFERRYAFDFVPAGLFSRYLVKCMNLGEPLRYWRYGALIFDKKSNATALVELKPQSSVLTIIVRSDHEVTSFFCKLVELFEFFIEHFFKVEGTAQYLDPITGAQFSIEQIEEATVMGHSSIASKEGIQISIDRIAPDLALTTFQSLQIDVDKEITLGKILGEGAFAIVHEGNYGNEQVAIKRLLRCSTKEEQKRLFSEFRREVTTMSTLNHPNIVNLKGFSNQPPFSMVMELVPHGTLYDFLRRPDPISWPMRIRIAYDIACAMAFLHSTDPPLIHKDLKSPNILMAGTKLDDLVVAKVADFGISGKLYSNKFRATSAKEREVENPTWLAPEVIKEEPYTSAADVYPYGIILWELCARKHPFDEYHCEFPTDLEDVIVQGKRPTIPNDCPPAFEALIQDCWHDNPERRPNFSQIVQRFATIIAEAAPNLPPLISRIRKDQLEYTKQQEAIRHQRDLERQARWKKMREEEIAREAERKKALTSSKDHSSTEDELSDSGGPDSQKLNNGSGPSSLGSDKNPLSKSNAADDLDSSETDVTPRDDSVPVSSRKPIQRSLTLSNSPGSVYHQLAEHELKDLWIQRGIPLQDTQSLTRFRLAEVLEKDDAILFNQRKRLLSAAGPSLVTSNSSQSPTIPRFNQSPNTKNPYATIRATASLNLTTTPFSISIPSLHTDGPEMLASEIEERNMLLAKQEAEIVELLRKHEAARLELHMRHSKAAQQRKLSQAENTSKSDNATLTKPTTTTSAAKEPSNNDSNPVKPSVAKLLSAFQPQNSSTGNSPNSSSPPTTVSSTATAAKPIVASITPSSSPAKEPAAKSTTPPSGPASITSTSSAILSSAPKKSPATTRSASVAEGKAPFANNLHRSMPPRASTTSEGSSSPVTTSTSPPPANGQSTSSTTANGNSPKISVSTKVQSSPATQTATQSSPAPQTSLNPNIEQSISLRGSWNVASLTAGGSPNTPHWRRNPQFNLHVVNGPVTLTLTMSQKDREPLAFIAFYIFKASADKRRVLDLKEKIYAPEHFLNKTSIEAKCTFPEGYFSIMCACFQPEDGEFTMNVSGKGIESFEPAKEWKETKLSGQWNKENSGGCMNYPTWRNNPKFKLKVEGAQGGAGTDKTRIIATLTAQNEVGLGYYVFAASNSNIPIAKSGFTTLSVVSDFSLPNGEYTIVPTTYENGKESNFELLCYSDQQVTLTPA